MNKTNFKIETSELEAKLKMWKAQHGKVYKVILEALPAVEATESTPAFDEEPELVGYFKAPDLKTISLASSKSTNTDAALVLYENCVLYAEGGDNELVKVSFASLLKPLFRVRTGKLKNA